MRRPCLTCGQLHDTRHTHACILRPSATRRGYGTEHKQARNQLATRLPAHCGYGCGRLIQPGEKWHAAHIVDGHPEFGWMISCPTCNIKIANSRRATSNKNRFGRKFFDDRRF